MRGGAGSYGGNRPEQSVVLRRNCPGPDTHPDSQGDGGQTLRDLLRPLHPLDNARREALLEAVRFTSPHEALELIVPRSRA